jgi:ABC-type amino acid transport system permease subunit
MVVNLGAYSTEIVRAGIQVTPKGQWEAGRVLGLTRRRPLFAWCCRPRCSGFIRRW